MGTRVTIALGVRLCSGEMVLVVLMLLTVFVPYILEVCVGSTELVTVAVGSGVTELLEGTVGLDV